MEQLHLELLLSKEVIRKKLEQIACRLKEEYRDKEVVIILILKGSLCFVADLIRLLPPEKVALEVIRCSSYGLSGMQKQPLRIEGLESIEVKDRHVLLVDDIYDSGETFAAVLEKVQAKNPKDIQSLVLLIRKSRSSFLPVPDYSLFEIGDEFVVGYGLDYKEKYRGLPDIYAIKQVKEFL